jgi:hypothetical protein
MRDWENFMANIERRGGCYVEDRKAGLINKAGLSKNGWRWDGSAAMLSARTIAGELEAEDSQRRPGSALLTGSNESRAGTEGGKGKPVRGEGKRHAPTRGFYVVVSQPNLGNARSDLAVVIEVSGLFVAVHADVLETDTRLTAKRE